MFEELRNKIMEIDNGITKLTQYVQYVVNNYDFHHKGKEDEVIAEMMSFISQTDQICNEFICDVENFERKAEQVKILMEYMEEKISEIIDFNGLDRSLVTHTDENNDSQ